MYMCVCVVLQATHGSSRAARDGRRQLHSRVLPKTRGSRLAARGGLNVAARRHRPLDPRALLHSRRVTAAQVPEVGPRHRQRRLAPTVLPLSHAHLTREGGRYLQPPAP